MNTIIVKKPNIMKKIFTFAVLMLLSITTLHATVVTKDFDLSGMSNYGTATVSGGAISGAAGWSGAQLWQWTEGASAYDQVVLEVNDHTYPILLKVTYAGEPSDIEQQIEMPAANNSIAIDITHETIKGIAVLNWSENDNVDITITGLYMRGAVGNRKNVTLWSGTKEFDDFDWENRLLIASEKFSDLHVGDILEVHYTTNAESYHQFDIKTNYDNAYPAFAPSQITIGGSNESSIMRFYIAESSDLSNIAAQGGLYLNGKYITFTKLSVIKHEVLWTGEQVVGNWSGYVEVAASKLTDLKVGNIICVRITAIGSDASPRVSLYDGSWTAFSPDVEYYFQGGDAAPMILEFPVTYKMEKQLRGKNLLVRGVNYTMTDIFVKEGSPVSTVAEYLNVSAAGMATYVLPFDVPDLPDGVEAYNLTNDGTNEIVAEKVYSLTEDNPVLIIAAEGEYEFVSAEGESDDVSAKTSTYTNGALVGTFAGIDPVPASSGSTYYYLLQDGVDGVAFYQVTGDDCSIAPYRAYLSCSYNSMAGAGAPMRIRFKEDTATGVESDQQAAISVRKVLRDGELYILRGNTMYTIQGQTVK